MLPHHHVAWTVTQHEQTRHVSPVPSCSASCAGCFEDAANCNRLAYIIGLSHNRISVLSKESFRDLPFLHTLLLDYDLQTNRALQGGALASLTQLEVLALGNNLISIIQAGWLKSLQRLKQEENLLTGLDSGSFPLYDRRDLESQNLTDNLIDHLDRNSFHGLMGLQTLDLSRNHLRSAPVEAFSHLSWLTNLNPDQNSWKCSCQLLGLAAFLSTVTQQPDKTLYNCHRMVFVSTDNPVVTTVLELTEASRVPSNQNVTVQKETRGSVMPRQYARDLAITAVICFVGGVGLTLLAILIYYQVSHRKKLKESKRQKEEEEESTVVKRGDFVLQANSSQPSDRKAVMLDTRLENHVSQLQSRADEDSSHFRCPECSTKGQRGMGLNAMRWNNREMEAEEEREKRRVRMMTEEERRRLGTQQGILSRDVPYKGPSIGNSNSSSHPWRETFNKRPETLAGRDMDSYRTDVEGKSGGHETLHCKSCHRTYRPPEQTMRPGRIHGNTRDSALFDSVPPQHSLFDNGRNGKYKQFDMMNNTEFRRESRNVKFDLECLRTLEQGSIQDADKREENVRTSGDKEKGEKRRHKAKIQPSRLLKVKLNLSPLRKSKVHPKRKNEQGHSDRSSSKKSKEKRQDGREEKEGKRNSGKKTKGSTEKTKKSTRRTGPSEVGEEKEEKGEGKGTTNSKQKKTTSKSDQGGQENPAADQDENTQSQCSNSTSAADQSVAAMTTGQGQNMQGGGIQYHRTGLLLGSAQLSSQHPFSLSAPGRHPAANLSLLGSAGSQLTGSSSLPLQGGNILLNPMAPGSNALFPNAPANSIVPSMAIGGPSLASSGALDNINRKTGVGLLSPATSLLANTVHANPLQTSIMQSTPLHNSQAGGLALNLAANPAINPAPIQSLPQSQLPPDSSPLAPRLKSDPAQGPGLQTGEGLHQLPPESQAPQTKEKLPVQAQAPPSTDGLTGATSQALGSVTTTENLVNNSSQVGTVSLHGGSTVNMSAVGGAVTEGPAVGVSGDSMPAADGPVSGVSVPGLPTQTEFSTGGAAAAATALLQQEYLSEEGGSSPWRKLRLVLPEKTSSRPPTALEKKIR